MVLSALMRVPTPSPGKQSITQGEIRACNILQCATSIILVDDTHYLHHSACIPVNGAIQGSHMYDSLAFELESYTALFFRTVFNTLSVSKSKQVPAPSARLLTSA